MSLKAALEKYVPYDEQEEKEKQQMLQFINNYDDVLTRNNVFGHFSASAFVVNKDRTNNNIYSIQTLSTKGTLNMVNMFCSFTF